VRASRRRSMMPGTTPRMLRHEIIAPLGLPVEPEV
jgi:hypothetical protein